MIANIILGYILPFILLVVAFYLFKNFRDERAMKWITIAVRAAEQIYKESGQGKEKFAYVEEWILNKFNKFKIFKIFKISKADLKNLIESAVYVLNEEKKKLEKEN